MEWYTFTFEPGAESRRRAVTRQRRRRVLLTVAMLVLLVIAASAWRAWAGTNVVIVDGGKVLKTRASGSTVGDVLEKAGITIGVRDDVWPSLKTPVADGMTISVWRAVPVTVRVDGREWHAEVAADSVGQALAYTGVELNADDLVLPDKRTPVTGGMEIKVIRVTTRIEEREVATPFGIERRPAYNLLKGQTQTLVQGENGLVRESWRVCYHDGEETARELIESEVVAKPKARVLLVGMVDTISRGGQELRFERSFKATATAYTYTGRNTSTGVAPGPGTVAVDPRVIPLGSRLYIDGYGYGWAMDVGRAIKGERIDVFFPTRQEAIQWGRRTVDVYILH